MWPLPEGLTWLVALSYPGWVRLLALVLAVLVGCSGVRSPKHFTYVWAYKACLMTVGLT